MTGEFDTPAKAKATCERLQVWLADACRETGRPYRRAEINPATKQR